jgi:hypothetical protein
MIMDEIEDVIESVVVVIDGETRCINPNFSDSVPDSVTG